LETLPESVTEFKKQKHAFCPQGSEKKPEDSDLQTLDFECPSSVSIQLQKDGAITLSGQIEDLFGDFSFLDFGFSGQSQVK